MRTLKKIKFTKQQALTLARNLILLTIGCFALAFGDAAFLIPCNIVSGGVTGLAIVINYYIEGATGFDSVDIVVASLQVILFIIGLIVLGKKFSIHTLYASLLYPLFLALIYRLGWADFIVKAVTEQDVVNNVAIGENLTRTFLAGIFGGFFVGAGVALCYLGDGSSGGFDVISFIVAKYTDMKEDVSGFIIDGLIIVAGAICMWNEINEVPHALIGLCSALTCALAVQFIYVHAGKSIIVDIISDKFDEIADFIHVDLGRGTTLIDTVGGYTGENRKLVRVVLSRKEMDLLREFISKTDPTAFVTFSEAYSVNGEGFRPWVQRKKKKPSLLAIKSAQDSSQVQNETDKDGDTDGKPKL